MANYLPLLLIGGGAAYMVAYGKKKTSRAPFLWVSDDCKEVKILGFKPEQIEEKAQNEALKNKFKGALQKWGRDTLDLEGWFNNKPGINAEDLDDLAIEISAWRYPQCSFGDDMRPGTVPFLLFSVVFSAVMQYAVTNKIVTIKEILESLHKGAIGDMVPLPDGVSASMVLPASIRMVLA